MKGQAGLIGIMAAIILAVSVAGFSIPISQTLANEAGEPVTDISAISELNAYTSNYAYNYLEQAARYSIHNKSYELGQEGGQVDWQSSKVSEDLEETYICGDENPLQEINCRLQEAAAQRTAGYGWERSTDCNPELTENSVNISRETSVFKTSVMEMSCELKQRNMTRTVEDLELNFSTSRVRFQTLAKTAYDKMNALEDSWTAGEYEEEETWMCGEPSDEKLGELEGDAASEADSEIESGFESVSISTPEGVDLTTTLVDVAKEIRYGTDPETFTEADVSTETESWGCCEENDEDECIAEYHNATVNVEPEKSEVELVAEDTENEVLTSDGWNALEFAVKNYVHSFE